MDDLNESVDPWALFEFPDILSFPPMPQLQPIPQASAVPRDVRQSLTDGFLAILMEFSGAIESEVADSILYDIRTVCSATERYAESVLVRECHAAHSDGTHPRWTADLLADVLEADARGIVGALGEGLRCFAPGFQPPDGPRDLYVRCVNRVSGAAYRFRSAARPSPELAGDMLRRADVTQLALPANIAAHVSVRPSSRSMAESVNPSAAAEDTVMPEAWSAVLSPLRDLDIFSRLPLNVRAVLEGVFRLLQVPPLNQKTLQQLCDMFATRKRRYREEALRPALCEANRLPMKPDPHCMCGRLLLYLLYHTLNLRDTRGGEIVEGALRRAYIQPRILFNDDDSVEPPPRKRPRILSRSLYRANLA